MLLMFILCVRIYIFLEVTVQLCSDCEDHPALIFCENCGGMLLYISFCFIAFLFHLFIYHHHSFVNNLKMHIVMNVLFLFIKRDLERIIVLIY